ncbi:MAG: dihydrofolate reductase family protein [Solirubrobacteraceae bacterium]
MEFRQLLPEPASVEVDALLASLAPGGRAGVDRPYTAVNFVTSADGRATFGGRSGPLGDDGDRAMFHGLREQFDAVMSGTRTLRAERYGRILGKPERRQRRVDHGQPAEPLACIVTRSGNVPDDIPLFAEPEARVVVFSPTEIVDRDWAAQVEVIRIDPGELTLTTVLRHLRSEHGIRSLLCEGGPTLFGAMLQEGVADELFLTLAPQLTAGGQGPTMTTGPELPEPRRLLLRWLLERNDSLYLRYEIG